MAGGADQRVFVLALFVRDGLTFLCKLVARVQPRFVSHHWVIPADVV